MPQGFAPGVGSTLTSTAAPASTVCVPEPDTNRTSGSQPSAPGLPVSFRSLRRLMCPKSPFGSVRRSLSRRSSTRGLTPERKLAGMSFRALFLRVSVWSKLMFANGAPVALR